MIKVVAYDMLFLPFLRPPGAVHTFKVEGNVTKLPGVIQACLRFAADAGRPILDADPTFARPLGEHRRAVSNVKDKQPAGIEMPPHACERLHQIGVGELIAEHGKHHKDRIEPLSEIEIADVGLAEFHGACAYGELGPSLHEHFRRSVHSHDGVAALRQSHRMSSGAAAEVEESSRAEKAMPRENSFDEIDFAVVVLRSIDRIVDLGVTWSKFHHAKHRSTA